MTENNTTPAGAIYGVTAEDLQEHRAELVRQKEQAYAVYLQLPAGEDKEARERTQQLRDLIETWDNMSDAERAEVIADARTAQPVEEPLAHQLAEKLDRISAKPYTDSDDRPTLAQASTHLIELQLGNEQKAEAMSNAEATIRQQGDQIRTLSNAQISGDDFRLREFWEKAGELAERAGYCEQYDHLAEELGGPRRTVHYDVTHRLTVTVNVYASSCQTAGTNATSSDFDDWQTVDGYDLDEAISRAIENGDYEVTDDEIEEFTEAD